MKLKIKFLGLLFICLLSTTTSNAQEPMLAEVKIFAGNFAPRGWAFCNGQLLAISQNQALFSLLGTMYGGDGRTTFGLPDLRGRVAMSAGRHPGSGYDYRQGQKSGAEYNILNITQLPSHNHIATGKILASVQPGTTNDPTGNVLAVAKTAIDRSNNVDSNIYSPTATGFMATNGVNITVGNTGGSQSVNNIQPYTIIRYIIALQGIFPSRS